MIDAQKIIIDIILCKIKKVTGAIMALIGFFLLVGCEGAIKNSNDWYFSYVFIGTVLVVLGFILSEAFKWEYEIPNWKNNYRGALSYSFTAHSWIMAYWYSNNDNWAYVLCDLNGRVLSKPIRTSKSFLGFKWYSL